MRAALYKVNPCHPNTVRKMLKEKPICFGWKCLQKDHGLIPLALHGCIWSTAEHLVSLRCQCFAQLFQYWRHLFQVTAPAWSVPCAEQLCWKRAHLNSITSGLTQHRKELLLPGRNENFSWGIHKDIFLEFYFQNSYLFLHADLLERSRLSF